MMKVEWGRYGVTVKPLLGMLSHFSTLSVLNILLLAIYVSGWRCILWSKLVSQGNNTSDSELYLHVKTPMRMREQQTALPT